jgi:hypothetical protein
MKWDEPRGGRGADIAEIGKAKPEIFTTETRRKPKTGNRVIEI